MTTPMIFHDSADVIEQFASVHEALAAAYRVQLNGGDRHQCKKRHMTQGALDELTRMGFSHYTVNGVTTVYWKRPPED